MLSDYLWYRKRKGGIWVRWYIDVVHVKVWVPFNEQKWDRTVPKFIAFQQQRPPLARRGFLDYEDWTSWVYFNYLGD